MAAEFYALASALCVALSTMFLSELRGRISLFQLARWQMLLSFLMTGAISIALRGFYAVEAWQIGALIISIAIGIVLASTTYFSAIFTIGPRLTALLFTLTSPFAIILGYLLLGETMSIRQVFGGLLVLSGVVLAIGPPDRNLAATMTSEPNHVDHRPVQVFGLEKLISSEKRLWAFGILLGVFTAFGQAVGSLIARPAMAAGVEPFTAMAIRSGFAALIFMIIPFGNFREAANFKIQKTTALLLIGAALFGTTFGMSLLMAALHEGHVGIISTLSSMTPVLILPLMWMRTKRRPSASAWAGAICAIVGTAIISSF